MPLRDTVNWISKAVPNPTQLNFHTQLGCHFEEIAEIFPTLHPNDTRTRELLDDAYLALNALANHLKGERDKVMVLPTDRVEFLDSVCDQIVTGSALGYMLGMDVIGGMIEVNRSNFSKFDEDGNPIFDENRKVKKGPHYSKADLTEYAA